ncbi:MAG: lysine--tRNA ligase [Candidatus Eisenbacteria bacterium]|nr:lysine--tRNA ligase [Candidatus Eisenbacteria bacterium]
MRPELIQTRIDKIALLRELGVEPYPYRFDRTHTAAEVLEGFEGREASGETVAVAGRILALRPMGKAAFAHIQDSGQKIQLYFKKDDVGEDAYKVFKLLDLGDIIGVRGTCIRTRTGEPSIAVQSFDLLSKSIRPLPVVKEKEGQVFDAWQDTGERYRRRYLDLVLNPETRRVFQARADVIRTLRESLDSRGFLEVETPVLQAIYGGAMARPFMTHHNALDMPFFLRIALELPLKKLLVGGFDRVYELSRVFRNEGMDRSHNPEFTMLEFYWAYADYNEAMDLVETMFRESLAKARGSLQFEWNGHALDFEAPFARKRMVDLIQEQTGLDVLNDPEDALRAKLKERGVKIPEFAERGHLIEELFDEFVEETLIQPTFVTDHPRAISPLAKVHRKDKEQLVERYELFICGMEFANAFSELNDPIDQRQRFEDQAALREKGDDEAQVLDEDFLQSVEYGMPPAAGVGIGVDRLVMIAADGYSLRDVLLFPHMRPEEGRAGDDEEGEAAEEGE